MSGSPGYSQSKSTPMIPEFFTNAATLFAKACLFASVTAVRNIEYVDGSVENAQPPRDRIRFGPWRVRNEFHSAVELSSIKTSKLSESVPKPKWR